MSGDKTPSRKSSAKKKFDKETATRRVRKSAFRTSSDIELSPIYTPLDADQDEYIDRLNFPGSYPFTRGVYPTMYRGKPWTIRQYAGFGTARETNARFHFLLEKGQKGLSIAFDLPTQMGYDSDDPMAQGEVGKVGVAIDSIDDMRTLFEGIPLDDISTSMTINSTAAILLSLYIAVGDERGIERSKLSGTVQNDILKEYIARGTFIFPPEPSMRLVTDMFGWCAEHLRNWNPISISGYHIREAGATAVLEIALTLANAIAYVEAGIRAGLHVDSFAPRLSFFFNVHNNFLEEVAKFRAARRTWAWIMKHRFKAKREDSMRLRFHAQTAGSTLTAQQPMNNVVRVALQALAAVLGGTQSLHTNSLDEALGLPGNEAVRLALRTQQIILEETGVADTIDPLGGSYAIEALTDELEARAKRLIDQIDNMGGMVRAIEAGFPQREIEKASYEFQKALESGQEKVVGVNSHVEETETIKDVFRVDPELEMGQIESLRGRRQARKVTAVKSALDALDNAAAGKDNLFPLILDAVKNDATLGEICTTLTKHFGRYREQRRMG
ncbi:MAG: methylmalonyl-CoA mutase family protein [Candidatus Krumholzibacteria bacterium]|nr:methylmalonyl-CoA mutase family protein [Candidatus Krumholzibacteria bacterium]